MIKCKTSLLTVICLIVLISCSSGGNHLVDLENHINTQFRKEGIYLANVQAVYGVSVIKIYKAPLITQLVGACNDFFIRNDILEVKYGSRIDDAVIKIKKINGQNTLYVRLKKPVYIASNRWEKERIDTGVYPDDIDVLMNKEEEKIRQKYEDKSIHVAMQLTRQYFQMIANKYHLYLDFKFID